MTMHARGIFALTLTALLAAVAGADDWPQWMGSRRDGVWRETGILERFPKDGPKVLWRVKIRGGFAGPAVADGRVYVMDYVTDTDVLKLPQVTRPGAAIKGKERVLCLDARTGKEVWKHEYDCLYRAAAPYGPRCTPTVHGGKVYTLGTEGNLFCLDAKTGKPLWSKDFKKDYGAETPMWGFTGHPLVEGKKVFCLVGGKGSVAVAFDKDSGKELWKALDASEPGYSPPTMIEASGKRQLILWDADKLNSLDPESGKVFWSVDLKPSYGMSIMAPRQLGNHLFAGGIGSKCALIELGTDKLSARVVWRGERDTGIYPGTSTPLLEAGTIYGSDSQVGAFMAVDLQTGKRLWQTNTPTTGTPGRASHGTTFVVKNGDRYVLFSETGHLILARLTRKAYEEIDRWKMIEPTVTWAGRKVVWSHPAFANKCVFARNDREIVCVSLAR